MTGNVWDMPPNWQPLRVVLASAQADEPMGSKEKWWIDIPNDERSWLLKLSRVDDRDGTVSGEDWAEWVVHHLAGLLGVPTATVLPATLEGRRGIVSRSVLQDKFEYLDHGNSVLSASVAAYDQSTRGENPGYTPAAVRDALKDVAPPTEVTWPPGFTAYDAWTGYLLMDAWVAGRDRHPENWAVILRGSERRLAPSFDHGNALAFQERDQRRVRMLDDDEYLHRWISRGTNRYFSGQPGLTDLALHALQLASPMASTHWTDHLDALNDEAIQSVVFEVPEEIMSDVTRRFIVRLLATTRRRLLDGYTST